MKNKIFIFLMILLLLFNSIILTNKLLNKTIHEELTTDLNTTILNNGFKDQNFYQCIVDKYKEIHEITEEITEPLTDEQLNSITTLSCTKRNIKSVEGIEKLNSLTRINISSNNISNINVGNNTNLEYLIIYDNDISTIDLKNLSSLKVLDIRNNNISTIDLSHNLLIHGLWLSDNKFDSIDLSNHLSLQELNIDNNYFSEIDLSNNKDLVNLSMKNNSFNTTQYIYENTETDMKSPVKLPNTYTMTGEETYTIDNEEIATLTNKRIKGIKEGSTDINMSSGIYSYTIHVKVIKIKSYLINEQNNTIYIGADTIEKIKNKSKLDNNITVDVNNQSNKLSLKYKNYIIKTFDVLKLDLKKYETSNNQISIGSEEIPYNDFTNQVKGIGVEYKIFYNDIEIKEGNIKPGMQLKVYQNDELIDKYEIVDIIKKGEYETAEVEDTGHNISNLIKLTALLLFLIGITIIIVIINKRKKVLE